jgi:hypothetical protein
MTESDAVAIQPLTDHLDHRASGKGAVVLNTSVNTEEFQLVYHAKEEPLGGSRRRIADSIVNFCKLHECSYVILTDGNCWISADKGISLLAQIEDNEELEEYDMVVMPLDSAIYIAEINEGLVISEKVSPTEQAIDFLVEHKKSHIAVLDGGTATEPLRQQGFAVNCEQQLFISGANARPYSFQNIIWILIKNRFYHPKLIAPLGLSLASLTFIAYLLTPAPEKPEIILETEAPVVKPSVAPVIPIVPVKPPPSVLNNNASQLFQQISPWITGKTLVFLQTCRLKKIDIKNGEINFSGQHMSNTDKRHLGCGYQRLQTVIRDNQLNLVLKDYNWSFEVALNPIKKQHTERTVYIDTMKRLELLAQYLNWQMQIRSTETDGDQQKVTVVLNGKRISIQTLSALTTGFSNIAAQLKNGSLTFNPNNLELLDARFELSIHTKSGLAS